MIFYEAVPPASGILQIPNSLKLKRTEPGGSILLLKLTKLTNLTKPKLMKKMYNKDNGLSGCIQNNLC